jgi:transposase-like protein
LIFSSYVFGGFKKPLWERNYIERWFRTMKARTRRFFNNFLVRKANPQDQTLHKALRPMVQLHKTTPNTKKTTSNTHNLAASLIKPKIFIFLEH